MVPMLNMSPPRAGDMLRMNGYGAKHEYLMASVTMSTKIFFENLAAIRPKKHF